MSPKEKESVNLGREIATVIEIARVKDETITTGKIIAVLELIKYAYCVEAYNPTIEQPKEKLDKS